MPVFLLATILIVVVAALALLVVRGTNMVTETNATWKIAATALGFTFQPKTGLFRNYSMAGEACDFRFKVNIYKCIREDLIPYTKFTAWFPHSLELGLQMTGVRFGFIGHIIQPAPLFKLVGVRDIEVGDPDFDNAFLIQGINEACVRTFLTPERQTHLMSALRSMEGVMVSDTEVSCMTRGVIRDTESLIAQTRQLTELAALLTDFGIDHHERPC